MGKTKDRLISFVADAIKRAHMRQNLSSKKMYRAEQEGYLKAMREVLEELERPTDLHSRYAKAPNNPRSDH